MGAGKNKAHRKKRISKHVLESQKNKIEQSSNDIISSSTTHDNTHDEQSTDNQAISSSKKQKKIKNHIKDPKEAHSYLLTWKHRSTGDNVWRFNKNTQSWLVRHMYDVDKIPKNIFEIMILYLDDLKGASRERVHDDAVRRAVQYKNWEKKKNENKKEEKGEEDDKDKSNNDNNADDVKGDDDDETIWNSLSDKDKRKQYKRARKVIDVLKSE